MLVCTWNVRGIHNIGPRRMAAIVEAMKDADILLLQEVGWSRNQDELLAQALQEAGFTQPVSSCLRGLEKKRYGCMIASKWRIERNDTDWLGAPFKQLIARATVHESNQRAVDVISVHIPNGSGNGVAKPQTFEALSTILRSSPNVPRIVGGDFNEPRSFGVGGMRTFGQRQREDGSFDCDGDRFGKPRTWWDAMVRSVLEQEPTLGLRRAFAVKHGVNASETSHVVRKQERCFDHLLVSPHFTVDDCEYLHRVRTDDVPEIGPLSDHSALRARLRIAR
jgi:endonuclease/exonuclease/phosphatase family metal-dependent hydrolase